jgi:hypothetical protein
MSDLERLEYLFFQEGDKSVWLHLMKEYERRDMSIQMFSVCQDRKIQYQKLVENIINFQYRFIFNGNGKFTNSISYIRRLPNNIEDHFRYSQNATVSRQINIYDQDFDIKIKLNNLNGNLVICDIYEKYLHKGHNSKNNKRILQSIISDVRKHKKALFTMESYFKDPQEISTFKQRLLNRVFFHYFNGDITSPHYVYKCCKKQNLGRIDEFKSFVSSRILHYYLGNPNA